jgi:serine/threonine protein kinase
MGTTDAEILGEGAFGEVRLGYELSSALQHHKTCPTKLAIKRLTKSKLSATMREHLKVEVDVLRRCSHPHVVPLRDVVETQDDVFFVMDYVNGGDLFDFVVARGKLDEALARRLFGQLADAVNYLHNHLGVIHHDVKLENLLVDVTGPLASDVAVKLTDFGLCCTVQRPTDILTKFSGTEAYCSPEVLEGRPYSGSANEVYAMGVVLYIAVTGAYPFDPEIELQVAQQSDYGHLSSLPFPRDVSLECRDLVLSLLDPNPRRRPTVERVLAHPFLQPYFVALKLEQAAAEAQKMNNSKNDDGESSLQFFLEEDDELPLGCEEEINPCEVSVADEEDDLYDDDDDEEDTNNNNINHELERSVMVDEDDLDDMLQ